MKTKLNILSAALYAIAACALASCSPGRLTVNRVVYRSVRTVFDRPSAIPPAASIAVRYMSGADGKMSAIVNNLTGEPLTVDLSRSIIVNTAGDTVSYHCGGQPALREIPPYDILRLPEVQAIADNDACGDSYVDVDPAQAPLRFCAGICYKFEKMLRSDMLTTYFYVNTSLAEPVSYGKVSDAFRTIYTRKPDALAEYSYYFRIDTNLHELHEQRDITDTRVHGSLIDYK